VADPDTLKSLGPDWLKADESDAVTPALAIAWSHREPHRLGEVAFLSEPATLGRGNGSTARVRFVRSRPGVERDCGPLQAPSISRDQLAIEPRGDDLFVRCIGRCPMRIDGTPCSEGLLTEGSVLELHNEFVFVTVRRRRALAPLAGVPLHDFGGPDAHGIVGESPAAWSLRERLAFASRADGHVLVHGASGTGKELAAGALHAGSPRHEGPFVARNAATIPESLADAELFGHARNYPNHGMPARDGLIGEAESGTLFLDEIGCLRTETQAHLLRVLDADGQYTRLGESRSRRADIRVVAATNASLDQLKHDFRARFRILVTLAGLEDRREDIPLLARHLLNGVAQDARMRERFFDDSGNARIAPAFVVRLLRHDWSLHIRELDALLWESMGLSGATFLDVPPSLATPAGPSPETPRSPANAIDADAIRAMLERCDHNVAESARQLGLPSRYALYRLMRKHDIART
jgi:two-component system nitrogen regulation response regulator GlnG/two-component system response regulator HydG